jgi:hypothetical protein
MTDPYHFRLSLSPELWNELLRASLPIKLADGDLDFARNARSALKQLQVRERVAGLLEDRRPPKTLVRVKNRAVAAWDKRKNRLIRGLGNLIQVNGTWRVEFDDIGTELVYGPQRIHADAFLKGTAEGTIRLLRENVEFPFTVEKRVGASLAIGHIHYDKGKEAVIGSVQDLAVHLGDNVILQLISRFAEYLLERQLPKVNPVPILKRQRVAEMVGPMGGPLNMEMGVDDLHLQIDEDDLQLLVRFGFSRAQIPDKDAELPTAH